MTAKKDRITKFKCDIIHYYPKYHCFSHRHSEQNSTLRYTNSNIAHCSVKAKLTAKVNKGKEEREKIANL